MMRWGNRQRLVKGVGGRWGSSQWMWLRMTVVVILTGLTFYPAAIAEEKGSDETQVVCTIKAVVGYGVTGISPEVNHVEKLAQSFVPQTDNVEKVMLHLATAKGKQFPDNKGLKVSIQGTAKDKYGDHPDGVPIGEVVSLPKELMQRRAWYEFMVKASGLDPEGKYWIVIEPDGPLTGEHLYHIYTARATCYPEGFKFLMYGRTRWYGPSPRPLLFKVYSRGSLEWAKKQAGINLLANPGFEYGESYWSNVKKSQQTYGKRVVDKEVVHSGKMSLKLHSDGGEVTVTSSQIQVVANRKYILRGYVKVSLTDSSTGAAIVVRGWRKSGGKELGRIEAVQGKKDWQRLELEFDSGDSEKVDIQLMIRGGKGDVWFDDLFLADKVFVQSFGKKSRNLIRNGSFEEAVNPDVPDWWTIPHWFWVRREGEINRYWGLDEEEAYIGKRSMKVGCCPEGPYMVHPESMSLPKSSGKSYTLSFYMKGSKDVGTIVIKLQGVGKGKGRLMVKPTPDWKRYTIRGVSEGDIGVVVESPSAGTVWIDAVQLEEGEQPSDYTDYSAPSRKQRGQVPCLHCPLIKEEPVIDGKLEEDCWQKADRATGFMLNTGAGLAKEQTEVYIMRDKWNLYIGFRCYDSDIKNIRNVITERDGQVFKDDSVEVFVDPSCNPEAKDYYHFVMNSIGTRYDALGTDSRYDFHWEGAAHLADKYWTAEMKLPLSIFARSGIAKEKWAINFCRENHRKKEYSCWSPTHGSFHSPERFGYLTGMGRGIFDLYKYRVAGDLLLRPSGAGSYTAAIEVKNEGKSGEKLTAELYIVSPTGEVAIGTQEVALKAREKKKIWFPELRLRAKECKKQKKKNWQANLKLYDREKKHIYLNREFGFTDIEVKELLQAVWDRNYYTDESWANLLVELGVEESRLAGMTLVCELKDSETKQVLVAKKVRNPERKLEIRFPVRKLVPGEYEGCVKLMEKGKEVGRKNCTLIKYKKNTNEVKIDRKRRCLLVKGIPFLVRAMGISSAHQGRAEKLLEDIKQHGFNAVVATFHHYGMPTKVAKDEKIKHFLDTAEANGLKVIFWISLPSQRELRYEEFLANSEKMIKTFSYHPAIIAWKILDEPCSWWVNPELGRTRKQLTEMYQRCKEIDPYRPVFINEIGYPDPNAVADNTDIVSSDSYPLPLCSSLKNYANWLEGWNHVALMLDKPYAFWIQFYRTMLTIKEERALNYLALIHDVRILFYFRYRVDSKYFWDQMVELNRELDEMSEIILGGKKVKGVRCETSQVDSAVWLYKGKYYLIAVNLVPEEVNAQFDLSKLGLKGISEAEVLFEGRKVICQEKYLRDRFTGYDTHVYRLN